MAHASRVFAPEGSHRTFIMKRSPFKDDLAIPEVRTKIDALVREYTGYRSLTEMCKKNPTLRTPPKASKKTKRDFVLLRKAYKRVTGRSAIK